MYLPRKGTNPAVCTHIFIVLMSHPKLGSIRNYTEISVWTLKAHNFPSMGRRQTILATQQKLV